jgi:hypothetical protein
LVVGAVPWFVEAFVRFGGPRNRLQSASDDVGGGFTWNLIEYLRLLDGPLIGPDRLESVSTIVVGMLLICAVVAWFGVLDPQSRRGPRLALGVGLVMAVPYLFYVEAVAPRFLLPSLALLAITVGAGVLHLWRLRTGFGIVAVSLLTVVTLWAVTTATRVETEQVAQRVEARRVAASIAGTAGEETCEFMSQYGYPQMMIASGCTGSRANLQNLACQISAVQRGRPGVDIIIALVSAPPDGTVYLTPIRSRDLPQAWALYVVPADESVPCDAG